jgi:UDP-N-acetylglucosamine--dolichyl-phosphate N-acetylglucosaminephosphotransferase
MMGLKLLAVFVLSFATSIILAPRFIERLREKGFVVKDMYKSEQPDIPTKGGLIILSGVLASLILAQLLFSNHADKLLIFYFIVFSFAIFGLVDDLIDFGMKKLKIVLPFFLAIPIALLIVDASLWIGFTQIELGAFYLFIIAPVYIMVVSNLINMHSGYNGLAVGLVSILFITVGIGGYIQNGPESLIFVLPILGATLAFLNFNRFPSRVFDGNIGSLMLGSALGGLIVLNNLEIFGVVILIPHILNFLMYVWLKISGMKVLKFGEVKTDGTLKIPHPICLKWTLPYYYPMSEQKATTAMFLLTGLFCVLGLILVV